MEQKFAICRVAVSPLRAEASDKAEICTQLLFGDAVEILERREPWWFVRNAYDSYEGWVDFKQLLAVPAEAYQAAVQSRDLVPPGISFPVVAEDGSTFYLPSSATLPRISGSSVFLGKQKFILQFEPSRPGAVSGQLIHALALSFLNAPYLWGGRTVFGIDCSGFSQAVFKLAGIPVKRDAAQQAEQGSTVDFLPEVQTGDLAFFDNAEGRIIHVGIMLSQDKIIHASGRVRIDPVDDQGIYNTELGRYTHQLRIIKRFF